MNSDYGNLMVNASETLSEEDLMKDKLCDYPFEVPEELPVDIRAKMIVCLIHCKAGPDKIQVRDLGVLLAYFSLYVPSLCAGRVRLVS